MVVQRVMKSYLIDAIEKIYDPDTMTPILFIITHCLDATDVVRMETRNDISAIVNLLDCGSPNKNDGIMCDDDFAYILNGINIYEDSDICAEQAEHDLDVNVKIIAINVGSGLVAFNEFPC